MCCFMNKTSPLFYSWNLPVISSTEYPGEEELNFALLDYIICGSDLMFIACLKLVQVSTVNVALGSGL